MVKLQDILKKDEPLTPLIAIAWDTMPESLKEIISKTDPIVSVSTKAGLLAREDKNFVRSDIGQSIGIIPEIETYYGPPIGRMKLRQLIAELWSRLYNLEGFTAENIAITTGATESLNILLSLFAYGKPVALMSPHWPTFPDAIRRAGGYPETVEIVDENHELHLTELERKVQEKDIKILIINFPNNPSGIAVDKRSMKEIAEFARKNDLVIISDEIYNRVRFSGSPLTMLSFAPERTVVVSAGSKEYLIPGHRVGYIISASPTMTDIFIKKILRCQSSCPGVAGQNVLIDIIGKEVDEMRNGSQPSFIKPITTELRKRRDRLAAALKNAGFKPFVISDGGIFMLAKMPDDITISDVEFIEKGLEMKKISAIPGSACGKPGWLRFCFGSMTIPEIEKFEQNLSEFVSIIRKRE
jgi:aspartate/methionine/tyrosine aminotransferase